MRGWNCGSVWGGEEVEVEEREREFGGWVCGQDKIEKREREFHGWVCGGEEMGEREGNSRRSETNCKKIAKFKKIQIL